MKKQLNETAVSNELREGSVFFRNQPSPTASAPKPSPSKETVKTSPMVKRKRKKKPLEVINVRSNVPTNERTNERSLPDEKRIKIRHTFDIYEDQLRSLHTLQLKAVQAGNKKLKLGDMVQQAIDTFLENENQNQS